MVAINVRYRTINDTIISQTGMPNGTRAIITIGEVNGIIDDQKAIDELGSLNTDIMIIIDTD